VLLRLGRWAVRNAIFPVQKGTCLRVPAAESGRAIGGSGLSLLSPTGMRVISIARGNAGDGGSEAVYDSIVHPLPSSLALTTWARIGMHVSFSGQSQRVLVTVNGKTVFVGAAVGLGSTRIVSVELGNEARGQPFVLDADSVMVSTSDALPTGTPAPGEPTASAGTTAASPTDGTSEECGTLQGQIDEAAAGSVLHLTGCTYHAGAIVNKPLTIEGATLPSPTPPSTTSPPIVVTTNDVTIDGVTITSSGQTGDAIQAIGTASEPITNLTIRNCTIDGFNMGIEARHVVNLVIENCLIEDANYAGIAVYSGVGGRISGNTIRRIGYARTDLTVPDVGNNAYGITLDRSTVSGSFVLDPRSSDFLVDGNLIEDVPLWMGLNTHAGSNITFSNNTVRRCPRAIFIAGDSAGNLPENINVTGNTLEQAVTKTGGTTDIEGVLYSQLQGGSITNNAISSTYGTPGYFDFQGLSTGVTISGNTVIP
jgi:Right handed beta helix region